MSEKGAATDFWGPTTTLYENGPGPVNEPHEAGRMRVAIVDAHDAVIVAFDHPDELRGEILTKKRFGRWKRRLAADHLVEAIDDLLREVARL